MHKPFLKWAGSKTAILHRIQALLPEGDRLVEPFVGSGAVFLNTDYPRYLLSDNNPDLIHLYQTLQKEGEAFIAECKALFTPENNTAERYYAFRDKFNRIRQPRKRSILFVYLNRHGYNGLCRYNSRGIYNVPFGRYKRPYFPETEMRNFHEKSQQADFVISDFAPVMRDTNSTDVVYADPPYVKLSKTANFTNYSSTGFGEDKQALLAELAQELSKRGTAVLISNHATEYTLNAYKQAKIECFEVRRYISCKGSTRGKAGELLALF